MNILKFSQLIEKNMQIEINDAYSTLNWDEDYITRRLVVALKKLEYSQVEVQNTYNTITIKPFKLKGSNENKFGDLAIIIDIEFKDGDKLIGVAFLEAKKCYTGSTQYTALDFDQLSRIYQNAPNAKLLLYNYLPMSTLAPFGFDTKQNSSELLHRLPITSTSVTNLNTAIELNAKNEKLHKISIPFSYQFSYRYLNGLDLEFGNQIVKSAQGQLNGHIGLSNYVVAVSVKQSNKKLSLNGPIKHGINLDIYTEVTD